jgi:hypothetical protein
MPCRWISSRWKWRPRIRLHSDFFRGTRTGKRAQCNKGSSCNLNITPGNPDQFKQHDGVSLAKIITALSAAIDDAQMVHGRLAKQAQQGESLVHRSISWQEKRRLFEARRFDRSGALSPSEGSLSSRECSIPEREAVIEPTVESLFQAISSINSSST